MIKSVGPEKPLHIYRSELIAVNMDQDAARNALKGFLKQLRQDGLLLTHKEFSERKISPCLCKGRNFGRLIGRHHINTAIECNGLKRIRVPKKYVVLDPGVREITLSIIDEYGTLASSSKRIKIYAEQILEKYRRINLEEVRELMTIVATTGYSDCYRRNLITTEDTVYVVDTEIKEFFPLDPSFEHLEFLQKSIEEGSQLEFQEELLDREQQYQMQRLAQFPELKCYSEIFSDASRNLRRGYINTPFQFTLEELDEALD